MNPLTATAVQLTLGLAATCVPFVVGVLWQRGRTFDWRGYALQLEEEFDALVDAEVQEQVADALAAANLPAAAVSAPALRLVRP